jgi:hypothetical protein
VPQDISIRGLFEDYGRLLQQFYTWYCQRVVEIWEPEYLRYRAAMKEYALLRIESQVDIWLENSSTELCGEIGFLRRLVDPDELGQALLMTDGARARTERVISILRQQLAIPEHVVEKLRRAFGTQGFRL